MDLIIALPYVPGNLGDAFLKGSIPAAKQVETSILCQGKPCSLKEGPDRICM